MPIENVKTIEKVTSLDRYLDKDLRGRPKAPSKPNQLDTQRARQQHKQLIEWYEQERERQAPNRYQQAIDQDYYDNLQWDEEDAQELIERGQSPLVFNETAATVDWIIGTEKRTRIDFKVIPRTDDNDNVKVGDTKTRVMKWLADINQAGFHRSLAFADSSKVGVGWLEDGVRADPTDEPIYSRYESWRRILWDSLAKERDLSDARYLFRDLWCDLDIAIAMFPDRAHQLRSAAVSYQLWGNDEDEDFWYLGQHFQARDGRGEVIGRRTFLSDLALSVNRRPRVKLIEAWYRKPAVCKYCSGGEFDGMRFDMANPGMREGMKRNAFSIYDRLEMGLWCAIITEKDMLQNMRSPYRHNAFPFTPIWCYRRGRDGMPYGPVRRFRDVQDDLNKRASKALFLLSTNRVILDSDAVEDHDETREEAARPDAYIIKRRGSEFKYDNNVQLAQGHLDLMERDSQMIRHSGGVVEENLGRETNAVSGRAIQARQLQGSVVTAEIFDNLRYATQLQGQKRLSLAEQFLTQPKVIRVAGAKSAEYTRINEPEMGPDGIVRFVNDITASQADFIVDEQDFHQSVRQAMFETMADLVGRIAAISPDAALRILKMALEFSDLPNKKEMVSEISKIVGISEKDVEDMTPEERLQFEQQQEKAKHAEQLKQQMAEGQVAEQMAKVDKLLADAEKSRAQADEIKTRMVELSEQVGELVQLMRGTLEPKQ